MQMGAGNWGEKSELQTRVQESSARGRRAAEPRETGSRPCGGRGVTTPNGPKRSGEPSPPGEGRPVMG